MYTPKTLWAVNEPCLHVGTLFIFLSCSRRRAVTLDVVCDTHAHLTLGLNFGITRGLAAFSTHSLDSVFIFETFA